MRTSGLETICSIVDAERRQPARFLPQLRDAGGRQRPLGVVGPVVPALLGNPMTNEIQLEHRHQRCPLAARRAGRQRIFAARADRTRDATVRRTAVSRRAVCAASISAGSMAT